MVGLLSKIRSSGRSKFFNIFSIVKDPLMVGLLSEIRSSGRSKFKTKDIRRNFKRYLSLVCLNKSVEHAPNFLHHGGRDVFSMGEISTYALSAFLIR